MRPRYAAALAGALAVAVLLGGASSCEQSADGPGSPRSVVEPFDLQAHRGGMGLTTEEQPAAYRKALSLGVSTLELDTQVTADRRVVVSHDRVVDGEKCRDTGANRFVGRAIFTMTLAEVQTLDCGFQRLPGFAEQEVVTGARLAELKDVVAVWREAGASDVWFDIEIKFDANKAAESVGREEFVRVVLAEINALGIAERTMIQSFDWMTLKLVHDAEPIWPLVALAATDAFPPELAANVKGVTTYAPRETIVTRSMVDAAHERGLKVVPWTVDDPHRMEVLIALGVDGLITNYPDRAREVLGGAGMPLPRTFP